MNLFHGHSSTLSVIINVNYKEHYIYMSCDK